MSQMYFDHIYLPLLQLLPETSLPQSPSYFMSSFCNPLTPVTAASVFMGGGPPAEHGTLPDI